jgi:protein phosphatase PTC1
MQRLGKQDPALVVPQGSHNNSAGESLPGARSTFQVGVTEDRNKKCRRTMEDTHSYLYNFLNTPAPALGSDGDGNSGAAAARPGSTAADAAPDAGSRRASNIVETDNGYFAIFDGHAGTFAADWCGKKLHGILEDAVRKNPNTPIPELLDQTFCTVDQELGKLPLKNSGCTAVIAVLRWEDRVPNAHSATGSSALAPAAAAAMAAAATGPTKTTSDDATAAANSTTASPSASASSGHQAQKALSKTGNGTEPSQHASLHPAAALSHPAASTMTTSSAAAAAQPQAPLPAQLQKAATRQRVLYTANVGDARIVLCRRGKALRLSYDHKGSDENEGRRVASAGGLILNNRVNGVLAVTRALGDTYMKELVTGHPYTTETVIQPDADEFIILACDGV